jgi:putative acetyltransferase
MDIRCESSADYAAIAEVNILAFGQENEARMIEEIRCSQGYIPELSLVAEVDGTIVGHILFSYIDLIDQESLKVLALAPLAVIPQFQRRGIGSALVQARLEKANAIKEALVIVLGYPHFYTRFGFQPSVNYKITSHFQVPEDVFMVKPLPSYQEKYQGKVIYPPTFLVV